MATKKKKALGRNLPTQFVECRAFGHAWKLADKFKTRVSLTFELRCLRCGATRTDDLNLQGHRTGKPIYRRPDGYDITEKLNKDEFRVILGRRKDV